jgi:hypothetical protein
MEVPEGSCENGNEISDSTKGFFLLCMSEWKTCKEDEGQEGCRG